MNSYESQILYIVNILVKQMFIDYNGWRCSQPLFFLSFLMTTDI